MTFNLDLLGPGRFQKSVFLFTDGGIVPNRILRIEGQAVALISGDLRPLNFGQVGAITGGTIDRDIVISPNLKNRYRSISIRSTLPNIDVHLIPVNINPNHYRIHASVRDLNYLGIYSGGIQLTGCEKKDNTLRNFLSLPCYLEVVGNMSSDPKAIVFGYVSQRSASRQVVDLWNTDINLVGRWKVETTSTHLKIKLSSPSDSSHSLLPGNHRLLEVSLKHNVPIGTLNTNIRVSSGRQQWLNIPVSASVHQ